MKLEELIARTSLKAVGKAAGLDVQMVEGQLVCRAIDPDDPRYSADFLLPSMRMVEACRADDFDFFRPWLEQGRLSCEQVRRAAQRYRLGKTRTGRPMFWMIDEMMEPQDAHIGTGTAWVSTLLKAREPVISSWRFSHCLFGLHLLAEEERGRGAQDTGRRPVAIVESEASAVLLSELFRETLWMAYVDVTMLEVQRFAPLVGHKVTIYPRTDRYMSNFLFFEEFAADIRQSLGINISVATILEEHATEEQKERCIDLVEFLMTNDE